LPRINTLLLFSKYVINFARLLKVKKYNIFIKVLKIIQLCNLGVTIFCYNLNIKKHKKEEVMKKRKTIQLILAFVNICCVASIVAISLS
jgi:hypothetical protein